jgi:DNA-binding transcriptional LysR family regulator
MLNDIDLSRTDLNLLVLFATVREEGNVGRAATRLRLSPSAVSHGLKRLRRLFNDPLFLRTPKGVVPTARTLELEEGVTDVLGRVRSIVATARPFDPAKATRRFLIGAPDGISAVLLPPLLSDLRSLGPGLDLGLRQLLPSQHGHTLVRAWEPILDELEAGRLDIAIAPLAEVPARYLAEPLYEENFVIVARAGHPYAREPSLDRYCEAQHLIVSLTGDAFGLFEEALAAQGRSRRIVVTVPNFLQAMLLAGQTDVIAAVPRRLATAHAARFGLTVADLPLPRAPDTICAIATRAAMMDHGVCWLFERLQRAFQEEGGAAAPRTAGC